jgi:hypothetical protein
MLFVLLSLRILLTDDLLHVFLYYPGALGDIVT